MYVPGMYLSLFLRNRLAPLFLLFQHERTTRVCRYGNMYLISCFPVHTRAHA